MNRKTCCPFKTALGLTVITLLGFLSTAHGQPMKNVITGINNVALFSDKKSVLLDICFKDKKCGMHRIDLETGRVIDRFKVPENEMWSMGSPSKSGKKIVFVRAPLVDKRQDTSRMQLAIMDVSTGEIQDLTKPNGLKLFPSFSGSEDKVIFARGAKISSSRQPAGKFDIYEVELDSGRETRLTDFEFYEISRPQYLPGDQRFVFSGKSASHFANVSPAPSMTEFRETYGKKFQDNTVYVSAGPLKELIPFFVSGDYTDNPASSHSNEEIAFVSRTIDRSRGSMFLYDVSVFDGGNISRLTDLHAGISSLSYQNGMIAVVFELRTESFNQDKPQDRKLGIIDIGGRSVKRIDIRAE